MTKRRCHSELAKPHNIAQQVRMLFHYKSIMRHGFLRKGPKVVLAVGKLADHLVDTSWILHGWHERSDEPYRKYAPLFGALLHIPEHYHLSGPQWSRQQSPTPVLASTLPQSCSQLPLVHSSQPTAPTLTDDNNDTSTNNLNNDASVTLDVR